jgi:hypothetical protein
MKNKRDMDRYSIYCFYITTFFIAIICEKIIHFFLTLFHYFIPKICLLFFFLDSNEINNYNNVGVLIFAFKV